MSDRPMRPCGRWRHLLREIGQDADHIRRLPVSTGRQDRAGLGIEAPCKVVARFAAMEGLAPAAAHVTIEAATAPMPWTTTANLPPIVRRIGTCGVTGRRAIEGAPNARFMPVARGENWQATPARTPQPLLREHGRGSCVAKRRRRRECPELTARDDGAHERRMISTGGWPELCEADAERRKMAVAPAGPRGLRWGRNRSIGGIDISTHSAGCATAPQGQMAPH